MDKSWVVVTGTSRVSGMVAAARALGGTVTGVVVGAEPLAQQAQHMGFDELVFFEVPEGVPAEAYAGAVAQRAAQDMPSAVFGSDAPQTRAILGAVCGALKASAWGDVQEVAADGGSFVIVQQIANGKALQKTTAQGPIVLVFIGPDQEAATTGDADVEKVDLGSVQPNGKVVNVSEASASGLADADYIVGVGMGLSARDDMDMAAALADALNGEVACTLPMCDSMHWYDSTKVLGASHNSASPKLYLAVGISGSPNHMSGVRDAKVIVAVNSDPEAEIFRYCKYGIVGDLHDVVPALTEALKQ